MYRVFIYLKSYQNQFGMEGKRFNMEVLKKGLLPINTITTVIKYIFSVRPLSFANKYTVGLIYLSV